jgi:hypothetical protein
MFTQTLLKTLGTRVIINEILVIIKGTSGSRVGEFCLFWLSWRCFFAGLESCRAQSTVLSRRLFVRARRAAATDFRALSRVAAGRHA